MIRLFVTAVLALWLIPLNAYAARLPDCGFISHRDDEIEKSFDLAHELRLFLEVDEYIRSACGVLQDFENQKNGLDNTDEEDMLLEEVRDLMVDFYGPMRTYKAWMHVDPDAHLEKERRRIYMKQSIEKLEEIHDDITDCLDDLF